MKTLSLITLALLCQILNASVALKRKVSDENKILTSILKEYSLESLGVLDVYFNEKFFIERYTDDQLQDMNKFDEVLLKNIFPAYSKINESHHIEESYIEDYIEVSPH